MIWQGLIVAAIVGACGIYLARRWYRMLAGKSTGCGCGDCPNHDAPTHTHTAFNPKSKIENPK